MNLKDACRLVRNDHVLKAAALVDEEGYSWLYDRTGRVEPQLRYVVVGTKRYPTKAFGHLVAQLAGDISTTANDITTDQAYAPLKRLGYWDTSIEEASTSPSQQEDRTRSYYLQLARPSQAKFRVTLCQAYGRRCALSRTQAVNALEAAHIEPFSARGIDSVSNGLLLRADLHRLFDFGHLAFEPKNQKVIAHFSSQCGLDYENLEGEALNLPPEGPHPTAFLRRWDVFQKTHLT